MATQRFTASDLTEVMHSVVDGAMIRVVSEGALPHFTRVSKHLPARSERRTLGATLPSSTWNSI